MKKNLAYWIPTGLFAAALTLSGLMALSRGPEAVAVYHHLGYPQHFMVLLGTAKLLGVATLLAPGLPRLKEWAYAGFSINLVAAAAAHLAAGDAASHVIPPLVLLGVLFASWRARPESRELIGPAF